MQIRDQGLQPERTALAWTRTAIAILANAVVAARAGYISGSMPLLALAVALLVGAFFTLAFASFRRRVLMRQAAAPVPAVVVALIAGIVLAACFTGMVAVWEPHLRLRPESWT